MDDGLARVLARQVERPPSAPVDPATVARWCSVFDDDWAADAVVPAVMYPTFLRPSSPTSVDVPATGVVLHDELKQVLGLPIAIAVGYELELVGALDPGDRLVAIERVASVAQPRTSTLGVGRDWVIEVTTTTTNGEPVGIERFRMFGYRTDDEPVTMDATSSLPTGTVAASTAAEVGADWTETLTVDAEFIVRAATTNHVWAPAHHWSAAARAAGLADVILDTSSQVALLAGAARRHRTAAPLRSVELSMRRPILPGAEVVLAGIDDGADTRVTATVDGVGVSRSVVRFAT